MKSKSQVIEVLKNNASNPKERFKELSSIYIDHPEGHFGQKRFINAAGYSPVNLTNLEYEVKKLYDISEKELRQKAVVMLTGEQRLLAIASDAVREVLLQEAIDLVEYSKLDILMPEPLPEFSKGLPGNAERKAWLSEKDVAHEFTKKADLDNLINSIYNKSVTAAQDEAIHLMLEARDSLLKEPAPSHSDSDLDIPEEVKTVIKLRDEFPFLNNEDCPDKFKILIADKLTAYHNWVNGREDLKALIDSGASEEEIFEKAKQVVGNFELNLQIYDELKYYNEHGEILGEHNIFTEEVLAETVNNYSTIELTKRQKNLRTYISREEKTLKKMESSEAKSELETKVLSWKKELELVTARLEKIS